MDRLQKRKPVPKKAKIDSWYTYIGKDRGSHPCLCCHKIQITQSDFHAGHIIPASRGGDESITNIVPICSMCNTSMGAYHMVDFQRRLRYNPTIDLLVSKLSSTLLNKSSSISKPNPHTMEMKSEERKMRIEKSDHGECFFELL